MPDDNQDNAEVEISLHGPAKPHVDKLKKPSSQPVPDTTEPATATVGPPAPESTPVEANQPPVDAQQAQAPVELAVPETEISLPPTELVGPDVHMVDSYGQPFQPPSSQAGSHSPYQSEALGPAKAVPRPYSPAAGTESTENAYQAILDYPAADETLEASKSKVKKLGLVAAIVLVVIGVVALTVSSLSNHYSDYAVRNNGLNYTFKFYKGGHSIINNNMVEIEATDPTSHSLDIISAYKTTSDEQCSSQYQFLTVVSNLLIQGKSYNICADSSDATFFANFEYAGQWSQVTIYSQNGSSGINPSQATTMINSIAVSASQL